MKTAKCRTDKLKLFSKIFFMIQNLLCEYYEVHSLVSVYSRVEIIPKSHNIRISNSKHDFQDLEKIVSLKTPPHHTRIYSMIG